MSKPRGQQMNRQLKSSRSGAPVPAQYWNGQRIAIHVSGPDFAQTVELDRPLARIGHDSRCDVVLTGAKGPRVECYVHATTEGIFAVDLSAAGRNRHRVSGWLEADRPRSIGRLSLRLLFLTGRHESHRMLRRWTGKTRSGRTLRSYNCNCNDSRQPSCGYSGG